MEDGHDRHLYCVFFLGGESYRSVHAGFLAREDGGCDDSDDVNAMEGFIMKLF
jgi:hypothetical protein